MDIAIVGIDCRFPGAENIGRFWSLIRAGETGLQRIDDVDDSGRDSNYVPVTGDLGTIADFDSAFFGYTRREADLLDPQQRVFLESCWRALEDAGQSPASAVLTPDLRTGVFAGAGLSTYLIDNVMPSLGGDETDNFLAYTANDKDFLATRVAFKLDLQGPAITVQSACSTGLVAVHLACQSLLLGECDVALAGGVTIRTPEGRGYVAVAGGIESPEGCCRPFDADASGTVFSNGVGTIVLKPLAVARAAGDRIYAVIKGTAVNNDGAGKASFTAPSAAGQAAVIMEALAVADVAPESIAFVETHGTGTSLGDAVELDGLTQVFGECPPRSCALGAVKANIGHTDVAAGIAGLIKAALSLHHRTLPPLAHWRAPGAASPLGKGALFAPVEAQALVPRGGPIRAGVSAFGVGGTNAHVVLEAAPVPQAVANDDRPQLLLWSARGEAARARQVDLLAGRVATEGAIADLAWSLQTGRAALPDRAALAVRDATDAAAAFASAKRVRTGTAGSKPRLAFLFPGQGAQSAGMARALYAQEPVFAATIDNAAKQLLPTLGFDLRDLLLAPAGDAAARARLTQTAITQPAMLTVSVAMLRLLKDWGLNPDVVIGHSLGEYAAMVAAGVLRFDAALDLVAARGRLMQAMPGGRMAAVLAPAADVRPHLAPGAEIAAINSPTDCVVCGPADAVAATLVTLEHAGLAARALDTSHAFHSAMIEPMLPDFARLAAACDRSTPRIPLISNLTGQPLAAATADYFTAQIRQPVRFGDGVATLLAGGPVVALEIGPGTTLGGLGKRQGLRSFATMPPGGDRQQLLDAVGALWCEGFDPDWTKLHAAPRQRVDLPTYPFEPTRHWIEPRARVAAKPVEDDCAVHVAGWRRHHPAARVTPSGRWAVCGANAAPIIAALNDLGAEAGDDARSCDGLIVGDLAATALPPLLAVAIESGRLRDCLFLLPGFADVQGTESLDPEAARLAGIALALARERPEIAVRIVDPGDLAAPAMLPDFLAAPPPLSAWRGRSCWTPDFALFDWPAAFDPAADGAYLVIGATGLIGGIAATALQRANPHAPLYLASRSGAPVVGVEGQARAIDAADIKPLIDEIVVRHGRLHGVIFAAGSLTPDAFAAVTDPRPTAYTQAKIHGVAALAAALERVDCGFVLVCGSLSGWLGGIGYAGYAGANLAAASLAANAGRNSNTSWISLSLDAVAGGSMLHGGLAEIPAKALGDLIGNLARTAPALGSVELVVSASDLASRYAGFAASIGMGAAQEMHAEDGQAAPQADPLTSAWCAVLGVEEAADEDSFFALGGSSLQALQLLARVRREIGVELPLAAMFEAPTLGALRDRLQHAPRAIVAPAPDDRLPAPLSAGQLSLWLAEQRAETAGRFNIAELYRLDGAFDAAAFGVALAAIEARHDVLRTRFVERDGTPVQIVDPPGRALLFEETLGAAQLGDRVAQEVHRKVDLAAAPAWRVTLLDAGDAGRLVLLSAHHMLFDDWSIGLFFEQLADAYDRAVAGEGGSAAPSPPAFAAFCRRQQAALASGSYEAGIDAWQAALADAPRRLPLAAPAMSDQDGALPISLDARTLAALRTLGDGQRASLFVVLLAIYKLALAAETGARDIVVGTPLAGRPPGEGDTALGYFVNPAALRTDLSDAADVASLIDTVKTTVLAAAALEQVPYERVVARLGAGPSGLFNGWFTILTHAAPRAMAGDLRFVPTRLGPRPSRFDLALILEPDGDAMTGWLEYDGARAGQATASRVAAHVAQIAARVVADPDLTLADLLATGDGASIVRLSLVKRPARRGASPPLAESAR